MASLYKLIQALAGRENGRDCRRCGEAIAREDVFGLSEGVCTPCRL
jgi:hypothetical protein